MTIYTGTQINDSAVLVFPAAAEITDARCKAIVVTANGAAVAAAATAPFMGIGLITNDFPIPAGGDVHVQVKEIGLVEVGTTVTAGAAVTSDANGKIKPAATGEHVLGFALEAGAAGDRIEVQINKYLG